MRVGWVRIRVRVEGGAHIHSTTCSKRMNIVRGWWDCHPSPLLHVITAPRPLGNNGMRLSKSEILTASLLY